MEQQTYRPRFLIILVLALVVGQFLSVSYLKSDFEKRISECYDAINTNSVLQGAMVNMLVEKQVIERQELLQEAAKLSKSLKSMMETMKKQQQQSEGEGAGESPVQ